MGAKKVMRTKDQQPNINTAWFRDRIIDRKTSQRKLAKAMHLDPAAISLMLRGKQGISPQHAEMFAIELGVPLADVLENIGVNATAGASETATIKGSVSDGGIVTMGKVVGSRKVAAPIGMASGSAVLRFHSEGYTDGWLAFYFPVTGLSESVGRLCVIQVLGKNEWYLRVLRRNPDKKGTYTLVDAFTGRPALEDVRVASASPVVWIRTGA